MSTSSVKIGIKGRSVPAGGHSGYILQKQSDDDFDMQWAEPAGGTSANIPQPSTTTPLPDSESGTYGGGASFSSYNHRHPINVSSTASDVKMNGTRSLGSATTYARTDHVHAHDTYSTGLVVDYNANVFSGSSRPANPVKGQICFVLVS